MHIGNFENPNNQIWFYPYPEIMPFDIQIYVDIWSALVKAQATRISTIQLILLFCWKKVRPSLLTNSNRRHKRVGISLRTNKGPCLLKLLSHWNWQQITQPKTINAWHTLGCATSLQVSTTLTQSTTTS
jgi:hypothetical protein